MCYYYYYNTLLKNAELKKYILVYEQNKVYERARKQKLDEYNGLITHGTRWKQCLWIVRFSKFKKQHVMRAATRWRQCGDTENSGNTVHMDSPHIIRSEMRWRLHPMLKTWRVKGKEGQLINKLMGEIGRKQTWWKQIIEILRGLKKRWCKISDWPKTHLVQFVMKRKECQAKFTVAELVRTTIQNKDYMCSMHKYIGTRNIRSVG